VESFVLGIDIGTSYTAAAIGRRAADGSVSFEPLELGTRKAAVPTVVYLGPDGEVVVGEPAERRSLEQPDRVVREFKRRIGDETPLIVGDLSVPAEDLFAVLARWVVERAEEHEGSAPGGIAISHPASWGEHRVGRIRDALAGVGLAGADLVSEPEAAGLHYLSHERVDAGAIVAVYDLGGGTFDVALLRKRDDDAFELIGAPTGIDRLGGADFDQRIYDHVRELASEAFADADGSAPDQALALARVRRDCTEAKEALSFDAETVVPVLLPTGQARVRLVRSEFEQMIDDALRSTVRTLQTAITDAGLDTEDVSAVLLIGGSSRIPSVAQLISAELELPVAVDADPKAAISLGAAVAAARAMPAAVPEASTDGSPSGTAPAPVPAIVRTDPEARAGMSMGVRAIVLAGVAAALLALLIPITPLAAGDKEEQGGDPGGAGESGTGVPAGRYVVGAGLPTGQLPTDGSSADAGDRATGSDPEGDPAAARRAVSETDRGVTAPSSSSSSAPQDTGSSTSPEGNPGAQVDPSPSPNPTPDPIPDPTPDPVPNPDPTPQPDPEPTPDPVPDPQPDPTPEPIADTQPSPDPTPEPEPTPTPTEP